MISQEARRLALQEALTARRFDQKLCLSRAKALKRGGLDAIAAMDLDLLIRRLRDCEEASPPPAQRSRLAALLDRINLDGRAIAIRKGGAARPALPR